MGRSKRNIRALAICLLCAAGPAGAHEIPSDVTVQIIVKPEGDRLELLVRAPLEAMQDMNFPTFGPGYLDIDAAGDRLRDAAQVWLANDIVVFEGSRELARPRLEAVRVSIPSDRSFSAYESAIAHIRGPPLPASTQLVWQQALIDVLFVVPISDPESEFSIRPNLERLGLAVVIVVRFVAPDGRERVFELHEPETLRLDPRWHHAAWRFVQLGFDHILDGRDHLLFLLCLVLPFWRDVRALVWIVTAFTVAHSVTLIGSAYGLRPSAIWFPPFIEAAIAASILYMAIENVLRPQMRMRWVLAFAFGLLHGFGFAFALGETLQFAGDHILLALLSFNVGVELGQLAVLAVFIAILAALFKVTTQQRAIAIIICVFVGHTAWHWLLERWSVFSAFWTANT